MTRAKKSPALFCRLLDRARVFVVTVLAHKHFKHFYALSLHFSRATDINI